MPRIVTFGEIMLRLKPPECRPLVQAEVLEATFGGAEANVAVSLACFGLDSRYVTVVPGHDIGQACINALRRWGVDTSCIRRAGTRLGIYFVEAGAMQRPSKVIYDRAHSAIAEVRPGDIDWDVCLADSDWLHVTGITPAISEGAAAVAIEGMRAAKAKGLTVSCDLNYRKNLWQWGKKASEVMPELAQLADVAIGNEEDADKVFGIRAPGADVEAGKVDAEAYRYVCEELVKRFPNLKKVAITLRGSISASHNTWSGVLFDGQQLHTAPTYDVTHIVDRVGAGDAFAAGLIYCLATGKPDDYALLFAVAAGCLKHSILGDFNPLSVSAVEALVAGGGSGRVQR